ncbi:MAG: hypothetical protein ABIK09_04655 [Pseudomonadota bacterium]
MVRHLIVVFSIAALVVACGGEKKSGGGAGGGAEEWPAAMNVMIDPAGGNIKGGEKADLSLVNNTGGEYQYAWTTKDKCTGKLLRKKDEPFAVKYQGKAAAEECTEEITVTLTGDGKSISKTFHITTAGDLSLGSVELDPEDKSAWKFINDYDEKAFEPKEIECKRKVKRTVEDDEGNPKEIQEIETKLVDGMTTNRLGGHFNSWGYEFGICKFIDAPDGESDVMALEYYLPQLNSYCGYADHFATGEDCLAEPFDLSGYETITFKLKSGDGQTHWPLFEIVGWSEFADAHQGSWEASNPLEAPAGEWRRHELNIMHLIKDPNVIDPSEIKSVGFRINQTELLKDGAKVINGNEGLILIEDLALIKKPEA